MRRVGWWFVVERGQRIVELDQGGSSNGPAETRPSTAPVGLQNGVSGVFRVFSGRWNFFVR